MKSRPWPDLRLTFFVGVFAGAPWLVGSCAKQQSASNPVTTAPAAAETAASAPAQREATSQPGSNADGFKYTISLKGPDDKAVDWLVVEQWDKTADSGYARGEWVSANKMKIETMNAERIRLRLSRLPIAPGKRIIINLDGKGIEIARSLLPTIRMQRSKTGRWAVVKD